MLVELSFAALRLLLALSGDAHVFAQVLPLLLLSLMLGGALVFRFVSFPLLLARSGLGRSVGLPLPLWSPNFIRDLANSEHQQIREEILLGHDASRLKRALSNKPYG